MPRSLTRAEVESRIAWTRLLDKQLHRTVSRSLAKQNKCWPTEAEVQTRMAEIKAKESARLATLDDVLDGRWPEALRG